MATGSTTSAVREAGSEEIVDSVARVLNAAGIPCVLWGHFLWATHGVPTYIPLDLVIPDASLAAASEAMTAARFSPPLVACLDPTTCIDGSSPDRQHPHPAFHMHIEDTTPGLTVSSVCLHLQSETLWFLPPLRASLASPRTCRLPRYLALACDRTALPPDELGMGRGVFHSDQTVVVVPKAHILTEALMRIMARDRYERVGMWAVQHFLYIALYVEERGILDLRLLPEPLGKLYKELTGRGHGNAMVKLMRTLGVPVLERLYR
ncbi:hypothetical protein C8A03DRAFT_37959 [Achaetomium macrosporum]|uniref:Nucleotidyltransferase family protein n=1 Tax=Achaetomium macrosporum TaxID=79813 RepID=A0AAN7C2T2_9PEZI|nr:hypothetical protein C8A03DRAFT_37959 [Achaetomium macrosporum]